MKTVGIITLINYNNYGNRLQNYAVQEVLKSIGANPITILNSEIVIKDDFVTKIKKIIEKNNIKSLTRKIIKKANYSSNKRNKLLNFEKEKKFKNFSTKHIMTTDYIININNLPKDIEEKFDYFLVGSDQVWNPYFRHGSHIDFLRFAKKEKRIAYSASFGIDEIPKEFIEIYSKWLSEMNRISVREDAGAKIIKTLTNKDVEVLIDPTLMLSKDDWLKISRRHKDKPKKEYILTYFLGESVEYSNYINSLAKEYNWKIVNLSNLQYEEFYLTDPSEFIDLINDAKIFFTDSFHGVAFSIIMNTAFVVFDRKGIEINMNSRMNTILKTFNLEERVFSNIGNIENIFEIDASIIEKILEEKRRESLDFLKESFDLNN